MMATISFMDFTKNFLTFLRRDTTLKCPSDTAMMQLVIDLDHRVICLAKVSSSGNSPRVMYAKYGTVESWMT